MSFLGRLFGIDERSAAAFRVAIALIVLRDLWVRSSSLTAHYTDRGVLPRSMLIGEYASAGGWSLHMLSGTFASQALLMTIAALAGVAMLVGFRTRLATVVTWALLASIQARNPWVCNAGDTLLRVMLFWSMFVPLGAAWSIDAMQRRALPAGGVAPSQSPLGYRTLLSFGTAALLLQLCAMYWMTAASKWNEVWFTGEAMQRVLQYDLYLKGTGQWLRDQPAILHAMSVGTPWLELLAPTLCFVPFATRWFRLVVILVMVGFHIGIELTMTTGLFQYVAMASWLVFFPGAFWEGLRPLHYCVRRVGPMLGRPMGWVASRLPEPRPPMRWGPECNAAAQVVAGALVVWVIVGSIDHLKTGRVRLDRPPKAYVGLIDPLTDEARQGVRAVYEFDEAAPEEPLTWIERVTRLGIEWSMFGRPIVRDGWHVLAGTLADGRQISLLEGGAAFDPYAPVVKPAVPSRLYPDHRWRKYMANVTQERWDTRRQPLAGTICLSWNEAHPDQPITNLVIYFNEERFAAAKPDAPKGQATPMRRLTLWRGPCPRPSDLTPPPPDPGGL